uniref:SERPIN domain-containing protein n=1 Tax=Strongyloides papillosus TaxID=174720 RepID=A0A0N5BBW3_STREA
MDKQMKITCFNNDEEEGVASLEKEVLFIRKMADRSNPCLNCGLKKGSDEQVKDLRNITPLNFNDSILTKQKAMMKKDGVLFVATSEISFRSFDNLFFRRIVNANVPLSKILKTRVLDEYFGKTSGNLKNKIKRKPLSLSIYKLSIHEIQIFIVTAKFEYDNKMLNKVIGILKMKGLKKGSDEQVKDLRNITPLNFNDSILTKQKAMMKKDGVLFVATSEISFRSFDNLFFRRIVNANVPLSKILKTRVLDEYFGKTSGNLKNKIKRKPLSLSIYKLSIHEIQIFIVTAKFEYDNKMLNKVIGILKMKVKNYFGDSKQSPSGNDDNDYNEYDGRSKKIEKHIKVNYYDAFIQKFSDVLHGDLVARYKKVQHNKLLKTCIFLDPETSYSLLVSYENYSSETEKNVGLKDLFTGTDENGTIIECDKVFQLSQISFKINMAIPMKASEYWTTYKEKYKDLFLIYKKNNVTTISSIKCEQSFSFVFWICSSRRCNLNIEAIEKLLIIKDNNDDFI